MIVPSYSVANIAGQRIHAIYDHTREQWGEDQADAYIHGMFARFDDIAARRIIWRAIPSAMGVAGYYCRYERHFIYWRLLEDGAVGIVTVLHERMHQIARLRDDMSMD